MSKKSYDLSIGEKLRKIREEKQMSLTDLSKLSGVPIGSIGDVERGRATNPSFMSVVKICKALGVSPLVLLGEDDSMYALDSDVRDISYLFDLDYLTLFRDRQFQKFLEVIQRAYDAGIKPETLGKLVDVLIEDCGSTRS